MTIRQIREGSREGMDFHRMASRGASVTDRADSYSQGRPHGTAECHLQSRDSGNPIRLSQSQVGLRPMLERRQQVASPSQRYMIMIEKVEGLLAGLKRGLDCVGGHTRRADTHMK